jgi:hypothetical protein
VNKSLFNEILPPFLNSVSVVVDAPFHISLYEKYFPYAPLPEE